MWGLRRFLGMCRYGGYLGSRDIIGPVLCRVYGYPRVMGSWDCRGMWNGWDLSVCKSWGLWDLAGMSKLSSTHKLLFLLRVLMISLKTSNGNHIEKCDEKHLIYKFWIYKLTNADGNTKHLMHFVLCNSFESNNNWFCGAMEKYLTKDQGANW